MKRLVFMLLLLATVGAMAQVPQLYHKHPRYHYTKWYEDSCPEYYNDSTCTRYWFHETVRYFDNKIHVKDEYTSKPLAVKGLVALVSMHERESVTGRLPEYLYLFQQVGNNRVIVDSIRWDTAAPMIINWKLNSHDSTYKKCYAYEAYFKNPYVVDSTFCIGGTTHSTGNVYIPELGYTWRGWYKHTNYVCVQEDTCWPWYTYECPPYGEQNILNNGVWSDLNIYQEVFGYGCYLAISDFYNLEVGTCDSTMGHVEGGGRMSDGLVRSIMAVREPGYHFTYWNDGTRENPRQVTLTQDTLFTACFAAGDPLPCDVMVCTSDSAMGVVSGSGVYDSNTVVTLRARGVRRCRFVQWNDGNTDNPRNVLVVSDTSFTAYFEPTDTARYLVEVVSADSLMGVVTGQGVYDSSSVAVLEAHGLGRYVFSRWNDNNVDNPRNVLVVSDTSFTAFFRYEGAPEGIEEDEGLAVTLSPNPTTGKATVDADVRILGVSVYDMAGKEVVRTTDVELDLSGLPNGTYIVKIETERGTATRKLMLRNR